MAGVNERLRQAAELGAEVELKALLQEPGCDALSQGKHGATALMRAVWSGHESCVRLLLPASDPLAKSEDGRAALMWAADHGHEGCVRLLLPVSDALAKDKNGTTASAWAMDQGHEGLSRFIGAYGLALRELASIDATARPGTSGVRAALRV